MTAESAAARGVAFAAEVETWEGTPFHWQQRTKGRGCDCKGLIAGAAGELGYPEAESVWALKGDYGRYRPVPSRLLAEGMEALFDRVDGPMPEMLAPGDVLLLAFPDKRQVPFHLAAVLAGNRAAHAQIGQRSAVSIRSLAVLTRMYWIHSAWRWRTLGAEEREA